MSSDSEYLNSYPSEEDENYHVTHTPELNDSLSENDSLSGDDSSSSFDKHTICRTPPQTPHKRQNYQNRCLKRKRKILSDNIKTELLDHGEKSNEDHMHKRRKFSGSSRLPDREISERKSFRFTQRSGRKANGGRLNKNKKQKDYRNVLTGAFHELRQRLNASSKVTKKEILVKACEEIHKLKETIEEYEGTLHHLKNEENQLKNELRMHKLKEKLNSKKVLKKSRRWVISRHPPSQHFSQSHPPNQNFTHNLNNSHSSHRNSLGAVDEFSYPSDESEMHSHLNNFGAYDYPAGVVVGGPFYGTENPSFLTHSYDVVDYPGDAYPVY